jgi:hypothetical protein
MLAEALTVLEALSAWYVAHGDTKAPLAPWVAADTVTSPPPKQAKPADGLGPEKQREVWRRALLASRGDKDITEAAARALENRASFYEDEARQAAMIVLTAVTPLIAARLREALKECSDDLAELVKSQYPTPIHPSQQRRYDRDMEPVMRARALLKEGEVNP